MIYNNYEFFIDNEVYMITNATLDGAKTWCDRLLNTNWWAKEIKYRIWDALGLEPFIIIRRKNAIAYRGHISYLPAFKINRNI